VQSKIKKNGKRIRGLLQRIPRKLLRDTYKKQKTEKNIIKRITNRTMGVTWLEWILKHALLKK